MVRANNGIRTVRATGKRGTAVAAGRANGKARLVAAKGSVLSARRKAVIARGKRVRPAKMARGAAAPQIGLAGRMLRGAGALAGGYFGNAALGRAAGAGISKILGQGDYTIQQNSLMTSSGPPSFADISSGMRVCHREYVADVLSSTSFNNTTYDINPANGTLFPWLQKIALNFEQYSIKGMVFYYNTTSGDALSSTNNALGVVGMTSVTDPTDPPLATKRECEDYAGTEARVPSQSFVSPVECKPTSQAVNRLYVYQGGVISNEDKKFYSHGTLNLFTQGMQQAGVTIGELWVSYDIEFYTPKILPNGTLGQVASRGYVVASTSSQYAILGNATIAATSFTGNLGLSYKVVGTVGNLSIPQGTAAGYYLINVTSSSTSSIFVYQCSSQSTNVTTTSLYQGNSTTGTGTPNASNTNVWHGFSAIVYKSDSGEGLVNVFTSNVPFGDLATDVLVTRLPSAAITGATGFLTAHDPAFVRQKDKEEFNKLVDRLKLRFPHLRDEMLIDNDNNIKSGFEKPGEDFISQSDEVCSECGNVHDKSSIVSH